MILIETMPHKRALCTCPSCGRAVVLHRTNYKRQKTCGDCRSYDIRTEHGHNRRNARTDTYKTWVAMRRRCLSEKASNYKYYGGLGIEICERWKKYENFLADMGERPEGKTLDRKDPYGNYTPDNCRWADAETQRANKRNNRCP